MCDHEKAVGRRNYSFLQALHAPMVVSPGPSLCQGILRRVNPWLHCLPLAEGLL